MRESFTYGILLSNFHHHKNIVMMNKRNSFEMCNLNERRHRFVLLLVFFISQLIPSRSLSRRKKKISHALEIFKNFLASFSNSWEIVLSSCANSWELFWEYLVSSTLPWKCRISAFQGHNLILRRVNLPNLPYAARTR